MSESLYLLRAGEAAKYVGGRGRLNTLVRDGVIRPLRFGNQRLFRIGDVIDVQEDRIAPLVDNPAIPTKQELREVFRACATV